MESRKKHSAMILTIAGIAAVAGAIILTLALMTLPSSAASFGWFAYAPLSDAVFVPSGVIAIPMWGLGGLGLLVGGVIAISYLFGRRSANDRRGSDSPQV